MLTFVIVLHVVKLKFPKKIDLQKWNEKERDSNWNKIVNAVNNTQGKIITYREM